MIHRNDVFYRDVPVSGEEPNATTKKVGKSKSGAANGHIGLLGSILGGFMSGFTLGKVNLSPKDGYIPDQNLMLHR